MIGAFWRADTHLSQTRGRTRKTLSRFSFLATITTSIFALNILFSGSVFAEDSDIQADTLVAASGIINSIPTTPAPATNVIAKDNPNDGGGAIIVEWDLSPDDSKEFDPPRVDGYSVLRSESPDGPFEEVGDTPAAKTSATDNGTVDGTTYYYRVDAFLNQKDSAGNNIKVSSHSAVSASIQSFPQWIHMLRLICLGLFLVIAGSIMFFISQAKSGKEIYIRKIAGIDAVDEAVGRATEMGRKVFFIPGIQDMNDVQTIAGISILGHVAQLAAEYDTWLEVPVSKSLVMVTARETMKEAYTKVGRPDSFQEAQVHYLTDDQFGYAAAIDGMVVREKPATIFYMGAFFAESLILAETGNAAGAIQIAGTAMPSQLPFFVASCDYTLIGEELFAASAYLSREPRQLGSLKGQDVGKAIFIAAIIVGLIIEIAFNIEVSHYFEVK